MTDLSSAKPRTYAANAPTYDIFVKLGGTVWEGSALKISSGTGVICDASGTFIGFALQDGVSGDTIKVRVQGTILLTISTDTVAQGDVGVNTIECTDSDTFRVETGSAVAGIAIGKIVEMHTAGAGGKHWCNFRGTTLVA